MQQIERLHLLDLDVAPLDGETVDEAIAAITNGLLVQGSVLLDGSHSGNGWPVVRFTGPRLQLDELRNRHDGIPFTIQPDPRNPDPDWSPTDPVAAIFKEDRAANPGKYA